MSKKKVYRIQFTVDEPVTEEIELEAKNKKEARMLAKEEIEDQYALNYSIDDIVEITEE